MGHLITTPPPPPPWALYEGDSGAGAQGVLATATAYFVPVYSQGPATLTAIRWRTSGTPTGTTDVGVYDANGNLLGHLAAPVANVAGVQSATLPTPINIKQGRYYLAIWASNATDTYAISSQAAQLAPCLSVAAASNLPATTSGATDSGKKPYVLGILSGGFS
jgi:hypothetical protein